MERRIGEIFEFGGEWYQCVEGNGCADCDFYEKPCNRNPLYETIGSCRYYRKDATSVIFKKLEKIGEPYEYFMQGTGIILVQEYILASQSYICGDEVIDCQKDGRVAIEIKQTKEEDMEENKTNWREADTPLTRLVGRYVNNLIDYDTFEKGVKKLYSNKEEIKPTLKEFDLEAAKAGKPVCTRDGRRARIICFDAKGDYPIIALIDNITREKDFHYALSGRVHVDTESEYDLMMLQERKEGWVNISNCPDNGYSNYDSGVIVFKTKEEAINFTNNKDYIDTVKVTWEE